ncbi:hypothetical protein PM082_001647 [Marasmius tenuissimus]|nr:hypothetical protein PM082_001647 [Marasmius tenuissimus]
MQTQTGLQGKDNLRRDDCTSIAGAGWSQWYLYWDTVGILVPCPSPGFRQRSPQQSVESFLLLIFSGPDDKHRF